MTVSAPARSRPIAAHASVALSRAPLRWLHRGALVTGAVQYGIADVLTSASAPTPLLDAVAGSRRPLLLIAAGTMPDEARVADRLAAAAGGEATVWVVEGAGHTDGLRAEPEEWEARVTAFLDMANVG